jgi:hypothetical protein
MNIYFIKNSQNLIKIGVASDVTKRLNALQTASPYPLVLLGTIPSDSLSVYKVEKAIHRIFSAVRLSGEWFDLPSDWASMLKGKYDLQFANATSQVGTPAKVRKIHRVNDIKVPQSELVSAMQELSATAFKLLMYYYSRNDGWEFSDEHIAKTIDSSVRMVPKYRKELIDSKYLLIQKGQVDVYFVGKAAVEKFFAEIQAENEEEPTAPILAKAKKRSV